MFENLIYLDNAAQVIRKPKTRYVSMHRFSPATGRQPGTFRLRLVCRGGLGTERSGAC